MINIKASTRLTEVQILQTENTLELRTGGQALQSAINLQKPHRLALRNLEFLVGILLFRPDPTRILLLGTGGGSLIHFLRHHYPHSSIISVDIDGELLELMHQNMQLPQANDRLVYVIDDALHYIQHCQQSFDLILVDIFSGNQSPQWLFEIDCIQRLKSLLNPNGAISHNLLIESEHDFNLYYTNLRQVFKQKTACLPVEAFDNTITYGLNFEPPDQDMSWYMQKAVELGESHAIDYIQVLSAMYTTNPVGSGII
jgi:spermidine synthase